MAEQGTRPVVFVSLKDIKAETWELCLEKTRQRMAALYDIFGEMTGSERLSRHQKELYAEILSRKADSSALEDALQLLTQCLEAHYGRKPLLLIDEYDAPIQAAWEYGYYEKAIGFFRNFLSAALKTNPSLDFAVLTGVLRIAKESIFSALNNLEVSSVVSGAYADIMGFTPEEVERMAEDLGFPQKLAEIREWYDGYNFSGQEVYNPWSVINYFQHDCKARAYWVNTSGNDILAKLLENADDGQERDLYALLRMETVSTQIKDSVIYDDIFQDKDALYTMLLATGYLKAVPGVFGEGGDYCTVTIPNQEVRTVYASEVLNKLSRLGRRPNPARFLEKLLLGRAEEFSEELSRYLETIASYHDTVDNESFYHGFMLGMLALLVPRYHVRSNRESGYGRFDLAVFPKRPGQTGVLMEFKVAGDESGLPKAAEDALRQIGEKDYEAEFRAQGIGNVWKYGIAFCGKKLEVARG